MQLTRYKQFFVGCFTLFCLVVSTVLFFFPILIIGLIKLIPNLKIKDACTQLLHQFASVWIAVNSRYIERFHGIDWQITSNVKTNINDWYLVVCNHQSWMDIPVLQKVFNGKIPMLKPFVKSQLKWLPLLGFAWWALDIPFVKRYSKTALEKNPNRRFKDKQSIERSSQSFKRLPVSVMSFIEGSRFTLSKQQQQQSPYQFLLKPKAGGVSQVLTMMGDKINGLIDVTILYPKKHRTLWDYLCGRVDKIKVHVREVTIPKEFQTTSPLTEERRKAFYDWINQLWREKDELIAKHAF